MQRDDSAPRGTRWLSRLVLLYPRPYRERFGRELIQVWRLDGADARRRGRWPALRYWIGLVTATIFDALAHHVRDDPAEHVPPREPWLSGLREFFAQDLRHALRRLLRRPGWAVLAILTLGIGLGSTITVFSLLNDVVLRPLEFKDPDDIVRVRYRNVESERLYSATSVPGLDVFRRADLGLSTLEGFSDWTYNVDTRQPEGGGNLSRRRVGVATAGLLDLLGIRPVIGTEFEPIHDAPGSEAVTMLTYDLWQRDFAADPGVVGHTVEIDEVPHTVIGVLPRSFSFHLNDIDLWVPLRGLPQSRDYFYLGLLGRLEEGLQLSQVRARQAGQVHEFPDGAEGEYLTVRTEVVPLEEDLVGDLAPALSILLGAVAMVLLVACLNVANLLLSRAVGRRRELALRAALGAGRGRLIREMTVESLTLGLLSGAAGLGIAHLLIELLRQLGAERMPRSELLGLDADAVLFALGASLLTGLLVGVLPALGLTDQDPASRLTSTRVVGGGQRTRSLLVVGQVACAVVLVVAALLLIDSFRAIDGTESGFDNQGVLALSIELPQLRYGDLPAQRDYYERLLEKLRALPGVESATVASSHPFAFFTGNNIEIDGVEIEGRQSTRVRHIAEDYLETVGGRLVAGRGFTPGERGVVLVNETLVEQFMPDGKAVGRRLRLGAPNDPDRPWRTIVGVVQTVRHYGQGGEPDPATLVPYDDLDWSWIMTPLVRVEGDLATHLETLAPAIRQRILEADPKVPLGRLTPLDDMLWQSKSAPRFRTVLLSYSGALALLLAAVGLYGVIAHWVAERRPEMGVRLALGASRSQVVALVLRRGLWLAGGGIALGLLLALPATRLLESWLVGVGIWSPARHLGAVALLLLSALLAAWLPARRAASVAPSECLRAE